MPFSFRVQTNLAADLPGKAKIFLLKQADKVTQEAAATLNLVTEDWVHKPDFVSSTTLQGNKVVMAVTTESEIFHWVDQGTQPHREPRAGRTLMTFPASYSPRTRPNRLRGSSGARLAFGPTVFAQVVQHPGIQARNFTGQTGAQMQKSVVRIIGPSFRTRWI